MDTNDLVCLGNFDYGILVEMRQLLVFDKGPIPYSGKLMKIIFFILREGFLTTVRKIRSKQIDYELTSKLYLTIIIVKNNNQEYFNISLQYHKNYNEFVIRNEFFPVGKVDFSDILNNKDFYVSYFNQFVKTDYSVLGIKENCISFHKKQFNSNENTQYDRGIFLYGLGDYSRVYIMPCLKSLKKIACVDYNSAVSKHCRDIFGFENNYIVPEDSLPVLKKTDNPLAIIATYHSDHTNLAKKIYEANKNATIFIEKPPCVTLDDLRDLIELYKKGAKIEIGFNRRYISYNHYIKEVSRTGLVIGIIVKELSIDRNHWYFWTNQGTRITGNLVHWVDLANYWVSFWPVEISLLFRSELDDALILSILYEDGSIVSITASSRGDALRGVQEKIDIRFADETIFIDDYIRFEHTSCSGFKKVKKRRIRSKGHSEMYQHLLQFYQNEAERKYQLVDLVNTTIVTYYASYMLKNNIKNMWIKDKIDEFMKLL